MPKEKNKTNKKQNIDEVEDLEDLEDNTAVPDGVAEDVEEALPEDVQDALGINKAEKAARIREVDYISELESGFGDFDENESDSKSGFEDFDSDMD